MPWSDSQFYDRVPGFSLFGSPAVGNPFAPPTDTHGPFGTIPKDIPMPNPFEDLGKVYPGLGNANAAASRNIASQLSGQLSPATQAAIQDASAQFGVSSGMPGSGLARNRTVRDLGLATEALQDQGLKNYLAAIQSISGTQTVNPSLQTEINTQNALNRAAPDPTQAAMYSKSLFDQYLANLRGPGGGTNRSFGGAPAATPFSPTTSAPSGAVGFPNPAPFMGGNTAIPALPDNFNMFQYYPDQVPEGWDSFSPQQQANYPLQLADAQAWGDYYE